MPLIILGMRIMALILYAFSKVAKQEFGLLQSLAISSRSGIHRWGLKGLHNQHCKPTTCERKWRRVTRKERKSSRKILEEKWCHCLEENTKCWTQYNQLHVFVGSNAKSTLKPINTQFFNIDFALEPTNMWDWLCWIQWWFLLVCQERPSWGHTWWSIHFSLKTTQNSPSRWLSSPSNFVSEERKIQ